MLFTRTRRALTRGGLAVVAAGFAVAPASAATTFRFVDDDGGQCPQAAFSRIQPAIDASGPGDTVAVCNGTYPGAVRIPPGKDGMKLRSYELRGATITPSGPADAANVVTVDGSRDVGVLRLRILGAPTGGSSCRTTSGIRTENGGSTRVRDVLVTGITQTCAGATAVGIIFGGDAHGDDTGGSVLDTTVEDLRPTGDEDFYPHHGNPFYASIGIMVANPGTFARIHDDVVRMPGGGVGIYLASNNSEILGTRIEDAHDAIHADGGGGQISPIAKSTSIRGNTLTGNVNGVVIGNYWNQRQYDPYQAYPVVRRAPGPDLIAGNRILGNSGAGILIGGFDVITGLKVSDNVVQRNRTGIELVHDLRPSSGGVTNTGNLIAGNDARFNAVRDCFEGVYDGFYPDGVPTALDAVHNTWYRNRGTRAVLPAGLCR